MLSGNVIKTQNLSRNHRPKERCEYQLAEAVKLQKQEPGLCLRLVQATVQKNIEVCSADQNI